MPHLPDVPHEVTIDRLAGDWVIHQLQRGHRFSADDMLTAWLAAEVAPEATRVLDLGAGIGSVGLMTLWRLPATSTLVMVEAQEVSHRLARHSVVRNGLAERVELRLGDLRDPASVPEEGAFDLVTGSPPYVPLGKGHVSPVEQRAAARMELRGTIFDYARTAARAVRPDGWFVVCFAAQDPRAEAAAAHAGLHLRRRLDVVFRADQPPMICVLAASPTPGPFHRDPPFFIRDAEGEWTEPYFALRRQMGTDVHSRRRGREGA
jgi:tRNA1Val (adenine37-N6)-methyltransferase